MESFTSSRLLRSLAHNGGLQRAARPLQLCAIPPREVLDTGRQLRRPGGLLSEADALVHQENVELVARPAGSRVTVLWDRDWRVAPTDRESHHADEVTVCPVSLISEP